MQNDIEQVILKHLSVLVDQIGARPTGSPENQRAGAYLKAQFEAAGWRVDASPFTCLTWEGGAAQLSRDDGDFAVQANPFSPPFSGTRPFVMADTVEVLEAHPNLRGRFVVLTGALSADEYMPLNFPFARFEEQQRILNALIAAQPDAVIGIHARPLFCDADFPIPSVTLSPAEAKRVLSLPESPLTLAIEGRVVSSQGHNVVAQPITPTTRKIVLSAHYDTWFGTPGAVDNATGVAALLTLAHLLSPAASNVEFVIFNGEDHYAAPGEAHYLQNGLDHVALNINVDGIGAKHHSSSIAFFGDAPDLFAQIEAIRAKHPTVITEEAWYQSDHTMFVMAGIPALAFTSSPFDDWLHRTHTPLDTLDGIDAAKVAEVVRLVYDIICEEHRQSTP